MIPARGGQGQELSTSSRRRDILSLVRLTAIWLLMAMTSGARATAAAPLEPGPAPIFDGGDAATCAFPAVVALDNGDSRCTGTLVHPRVVLYAAHCGAGEMVIGFGESADAPARSVQPATCMTHPDYAGTGDTGADWAFCLLKEPAPVPPIPVALGCERDLIETGGTATIVGYGESEAGTGAGPKRWAEAPIRLIFDTYIEVGGLTQPGACAGDSGGPALIQASDGTWRTFGIASVNANGCGGIGHYALAWDAALWVEQSAGVDITPCHDDAETWQPDFRCAAFAGAASAGAGAWTDWCAEAPRGAASTSCGPAFDAQADSTPPTATITSPTETTFPGPEVALVVDVDATDQGWGVAKVSLEVDGSLEASDDEPPFSFPDVVLPEGSWELVAIAEDAAGLSSRSEPLNLEVGVGGATGGPAPGEGCGCASAGSPAPWLALALWLLHRRRGARAGATGSDRAISGPR